MVLASCFDASQERRSLSRRHRSPRLEEPLTLPALPALPFKNGVQRLGQQFVESIGDEPNQIVLAKRLTLVCLVRIAVSVAIVSLLNRLDATGAKLPSLFL